MRRLSPSVCLSCQLIALSKVFSPSWQPARTAATLQKRKPSRMSLSPNVGRAPSQSDARGKPIRRTRNSPFGGMNVTAPPRRIENAKNGQSTAEQKRLSRYSKGKKEEKPKDPMRALKMQRALANVSYEKRGRVKEALTERDRFEEFDLLPIIKEAVITQALTGMNDPSPTPIQRLAIPALLGSEDNKKRRSKSAPLSEKKEMQQFLLAAETGSGKTLAYLLPVLDAMKRVEATESALKAQDRMQEENRKKSRGSIFEIEPPSTNEPDPSTARPRAIILVPTSELVEQVGNLVKNLSHTVKYRSALVSSSYTGKVIRSRLFSTRGIDIVISTPHLLSSITESDPNILSRVSHLVIDEADSLLDRSFSPITSALIDRATPSLEQLILCSATIPKSLDSYLHKRFPEIRRLVTPNLHAIPRRVQLSVIDVDKVPYQGNRDLACAQVIWDIGKEASEHGEEREKKIVVFVNEREKTVEVADYLRKKGIDATALMRDSEARTQSDILASFTGTGISKVTTSALNPHSRDTNFSPVISSADLPQMKTSPHISTGRRLHNTSVLVMTDIGSRGIDTLPVRHVILYDVPHTSIDFIHRLGRVGRMNRRGRGVVLVGKNDRKDVVKEVREGMFRGQALI